MHTFDLEIICDHQQTSFVFQEKKLHVVQTNVTGNNNLHTYNLTETICKENHKIIQSKGFTTKYKIFCFNKISLFTGKLDNEIWKCSLHQLDTKPDSLADASWASVSQIKPSLSKEQLDLDNCIPVSYKSDEIILVSVVAHHVIFHMFSMKGSKKSAVSSLIPSYRSYNKLNSCIVSSNYIFCCMLLSKIGSCIYKFDLTSIQQNPKDSSGKSDTIKLVSYWPLKLSTLQSCFLSLYKNEVIVINFNVNDGSNMKLRKLLLKPAELSSTEYSQKSLKALEVSSADLTFKLPCITVVATSVVLDHFIAVLYHDSKVNKYYIIKVIL